MRVRMTRKVTFSSGHRYWLPQRSESENRTLFGDIASPYNHGHNYTLWVTVEGAVDPVHGMIVNIKDIDEMLQGTVVKEFDGKSINDEIPWFGDHASSTENIVSYIVAALSSGVLPPQVELSEVRLEEMPGLQAAWDAREKRMTLTRSYEFAASHRLHVATYTEALNVELFGKCNNAAGHGHNYVLDVTVEGTPDPQTGMLADIGEIDRVVHAEVVDRYDHKHFNEDIPEFADQPASSEMIVQEIFRRLDGKLPARLERVRLQETARNVFEVVR